MPSKTLGYVAKLANLTVSFNSVKGDIATTALSIFAKLKVMGRLASLARTLDASAQQAFYRRPTP